MKLAWALLALAIIGCGKREAADSKPLRIVVKRNATIPAPADSAAAVPVPVRAMPMRLAAGPALAVSLEAASVTASYPAAARYVCDTLSLRFPTHMALPGTCDQQSYPITANRRLYATILIGDWARRDSGCCGAPGVCDSIDTTGTLSITREHPGDYCFTYSAKYGVPNTYGLWETTRRTSGPPYQSWSYTTPLQEPGAQGHFVLLLPTSMAAETVTVSVQFDVAVCDTDSMPHTTCPLTRGGEILPAYIRGTRFGDFNGDRLCDVSDVALMAQAQVENTDSADVNGDGLTDVSDVALLSAVQLNEWVYLGVLAMMPQEVSPYTAGLSREASVTDGSPPPGTVWVEKSTGSIVIERKP